MPAKKKPSKDLKILTVKERKAVFEFSRLLRQQFGPLVKEIILFGSKVRGDSKKNSDLDILIVLHNLSWEIKKAISELAAEENIKHNVVISTIRYASDAWENPIIKASPFVMSVKKEGIRL